MCLLFRNYFMKIIENVLYRDVCNGRIAKPKLRWIRTEKDKFGKK